MGARKGFAAKVSQPSEVPVPSPAVEESASAPVASLVPEVVKVQALPEAPKKLDMNKPYTIEEMYRYTHGATSLR